jgi:hypothetical protein
MKKTQPGMSDTQKSPAQSGLDGIDDFDFDIDSHDSPPKAPTRGRRAADNELALPPDERPIRGATKTPSSGFMGDDDDDGALSPPTAKRPTRTAAKPRALSPHSPKKSDDFDGWDDPIGTRRPRAASPRTVQRKVPLGKLSATTRPPPKPVAESKLSDDSFADLVGTG